MFKKMINWIKVNIKNVTSLPEHARIGIPLSLFFAVLGILISLIFKEWWLFICTAIFYIGVLSGFEGKQWDLQDGQERLKFWLKYKLIDSCLDVLAGSWLIIFITAFVISFLM